eukprot:13233998-Ditylum_brightwellii.AAC.1
MSRTNTLDQNLGNNDAKEEEEENEKDATFNAFGALTETSDAFLPPINSAAFHIWSCIQL